MSEIRILGMGAGVQTTALLISNWKDYVGEKKYAVFADTGDEYPETYDYIEKYLKPFCREHNVKWKTVTSKRLAPLPEGGNQEVGTLYEWCDFRKIVPIPTRRWCTEDWKIKPIQRFIKSLGATKDNPAIQDIGISLDESHRIRSDTGPKYVKIEYPLAWNKITRQDCHKIIEKHGWPQPPKSGCYYCPFAKKQKIKDLLRTHPELYDKTMHLQENARMANRFLFRSFNLRKFKSIQQLTMYMDDYHEIEEDEMGTCDSGHCFV